MKAGPHIVSAFDDELIAIQAKISEMGGLAEEMLSQALEGIENRDVSLCQQVIARDRQLDALEIEMQEQVTRMLALRSPVAQDLRLLIAGLKLAGTLERIGDLSKNTAKRGVDLARSKSTPLSTSVVRMGRDVQRQVSEALDAFISRDVALSISVWRKDVAIDELYNSIFRELLSYMIEDPRTITLGSHYLFLAKNIERIGDHATHIAEMTYYVVEGEALNDDRPKGGAPELEDLE